VTQGVEGGHIYFSVNNIREGILETARKDLVFKLDGNELPLRVVGFFVARHWQVQGVGWPSLSTVNPELSVGREDRDGKAGFFTRQKSLGVAGTTFKLFCEVKSPDFTSNPVIQLKIPGKGSLSLFYRRGQRQDLRG
jgi:hypothetical protein